jgi:DNA-directed RNA polymerase subunit RPC12/RpoP
MSIFGIKFECANCGEIFDQSRQQYRGIRVIGTEVVCPKCNFRLRVSEELTETENNLDSIVLVIALIFLGMLAYCSYFGACSTSTSNVFLWILGIVALVLRMYYYLGRIGRHRKYLRTEYLDD